MDKTNIKPGKTYLFKMNEGRGRPFKGTVIDVTARRARIVNRVNEVVNVPFSKILSTYSYKPHKKKKATSAGEPGKDMGKIHEEMKPEMKKKRGRPRKDA